MKKFPPNEWTLVRYVCVSTVFVVSVANLIAFFAENRVLHLGETLVWGLAVLIYFFPRYLVFKNITVGEVRQIYETPQTKIQKLLAGLWPWDMMLLVIVANTMIDKFTY